MNIRANNHSTWISTLRRIALNLIFTLTIIVTASIIHFTNNKYNHLVEADSKSLQSDQVLQSAALLKEKITAIELNLRNQLLINNDNYLNSWENNIVSVKQLMSQLSMQVQNDAMLSDKMQQLSTLIVLRIDSLNKIVDLKSDATILSSDLTQFLNDDQLSLDKIYQKIDEINEVATLSSKQNHQFATNKNQFINFLHNHGTAIDLGLMLLLFLLVKLELAKRAAQENQLNNSNVQLRNMIDDASDMIVSIDLKHRYTLFNQAYQREFNQLFQHELAFGNSIDDAITNLTSVKEKFLATWVHMLASHDTTQYIEFNSDNKHSVYEIRSNPCKNANTITGYTHIIRNITDRVIENDALRESYQKLNTDMQEVKVRNEKITLLLEMSDVMLAASESKQLSDIIAKYCSKVLNFSSGYFYIMHPSKNYLEASARWGAPHTEASNFDVDKCWSLRTGHIYDANIADTELVCDHVKQHTQGNFSYLCIPLRAQNDIYGLLYIEVESQHGKADSLAPNDRLIIYAFTEVAALALANIRLRESLVFQSMRDPLTSLYNRRYLQEYLSKQIYQSERTKNKFALLMIDVDHFKKINDVYGHDAGDVVLKEIAQLFLNLIRPGDLAVRYGGEEFILLLYNINLESAKVRAETIRHAVSVMVLKYGAQIAGSITVSIGIAEYPEDGITNTLLIDNADRALYFAKNSGRNKVVLCSEITALDSIE